LVDSLYNISEFPLRRLFVITEKIISAKLFVYKVKDTRRYSILYKQAQIITRLNSARIDNKSEFKALVENLLRTKNQSLLNIATKEELVDISLFATGDDTEMLVNLPLVDKIKEVLKAVETANKEEGI
jgi:hypothetical protein